MKLDQDQLTESEMTSISAGGLDQADGQTSDGGTVVIDDSEVGPTIGGVTPLPDPDFVGNRSDGGPDDFDLGRLR